MKFEQLASVHRCKSDYCIGQAVGSVIECSFLLLLYLLHRSNADSTSFLYMLRNL